MLPWPPGPAVAGCRWTSDPLAVSGPALTEAECVVPPGAPVPTALSVIATCRILVGLSGLEVPVHDTITALRIVEIPDRDHGRAADRLPAAERLALWVAVAQLRRVSILAINAPQIHVRPTDSDWIPRLVREAADRHRLVLLTRTTAEFADSVDAQRLATGMP